MDNFIEDAKDIIRLNGMIFKAEPVCFAIRKNTNDVSELLGGNDFLLGKLVPLVRGTDRLSSTDFTAKCRGVAVASSHHSSSVSLFFDEFLSFDTDYYFEGLRLRLYGDFEDKYNFQAGVFPSE